MDMMMCNGNVFKKLKVLESLEFYTHTHTHTHIYKPCREKNWYKEAMNESSWSRFLCGKKVFIGDRVGTTLSYAINV